MLSVEVTPRATAQLERAVVGGVKTGLGLQVRSATILRKPRTFSFGNPVSALDLLRNGTRICVASSYPEPGITSTIVRCPERS